MLKRFLTSITLPYLIPKPRFLFSNNNPNLKDIEQRAAIAYFALQFIIDANPEKIYENILSIRQQLINHQIFSRYILNKVNTLNHHLSSNFKNLSQIGLDERNIRFVLSAFQIHQGFMFNSLVYPKIQGKEASLPDVLCFINNIIQIKQQYGLYSAVPVANTCNQEKRRYIFGGATALKRQSSNNMRGENIWLRTSLNPMIYSGQIIRGMLEKYNRNICGVKEDLVSQTYLLYSYLSNFIIEYRMQKCNRNLQQNQIFLNVFKAGYFYQVKKMFYVKLGQISNLQQLRYLLSSQICEDSARELLSIPYQISTNSQQQLSNFCIFTNRLLHKYIEGNVRIFAVVDDSKSYYHLARQYYLLKQAGTLNNQDRQYIRDCSNILKIIRHRFPQIFFDQSIQNIYLQAKLSVEDFFTYNMSKLFNSYNILRNYRSFSMKTVGSVELYGILLYHLSKNMIQYQIGDQQLHSLRQYSQQAFRIHHCQNYQNITLWSNFITPLGIKDALQRQLVKNDHISLSKARIIDLQPLCNLLRSIKTQQNIESIHRSLIKIKEKIQQINHQYMEDQLKIFIKKSNHMWDNKVREAIIFHIRQNAFQNINKMKSNFSVSLRDIQQYLSIFCYNNRINQQQHLNHLIQSCNFVQFDEQFDAQQRKMIVRCSPHQFLKRSEFILQKFQAQQIFNIYSILYKGNRLLYQNFQCGIHKDVLSSIILKRKNSGKINLQQLAKTQQLLIQQTEYHLRQQYNIPSLKTYQCSDEDFDFLFKTVQNNVSDDYLCVSVGTHSNRGFDFALLRKAINTDHYDIITLEITNDKIEDLLQKIHMKIPQSLNQRRDHTQQINSNLLDKSVIYNDKSPHIIKDHKQFESLHFYAPFRFLRRYMHTQNLKWKHIILVPQQINDYLHNDKIYKKWVTKSSFKNYLYQEASKISQISCSLAFIDIRRQNIDIHHSKREFNRISNENLKKQLQYINKLTNLINKKNLDKCRHH